MLPSVSANTAALALLRAKNNVPKTGQFYNKFKRFSSYRNVQPISSNFGHKSWFGGIVGLAVLGGAGIIAGCSLNETFGNRVLYMEASDISQSTRKFTLEQVAEHKTLEKGVWVTYQSSVYDITSFVGHHPGGSRIMLAAGGSVEPFWKLYTIHNKEEVMNLLEEYKIGELADGETDKQRFKSVDSEQSIEDPFSSDPERSPILLIRSHKPFNAETPLSLLADEYITPTDIFYTRNHLPVPEADENWVLQIGDKKLSLDDIKTKFQKHKIVATIQCAGNRRKEMESSGVVQGLKWEGGAIGNAEWTGVRLRDLLEYGGVDLNTALKSYKHVQFEGKDGYGASVPIQKALDERGDVMVVFEMNGQPLTRDHGYPLRVLIPGHVAARSVKWLYEVKLSKEESSSHWQQKDYKSFSPSADWNNLNWSDAMSIQEMPVQSGIFEPADGSVISDSGHTLEVKGYAWSGGGRAIQRVDVSIDGGKTWSNANLKQSPYGASEYGKAWAWVQWNAQIEVPSPGNYEIICKAVDSSYNVQPEQYDGIYNRRGVLSNAWNRVNVKVSE